MDLAEEEASVWIVNDSGSFICSTTESSAQRLVETHTSHIYFFAELTAPQAL